MAVITISRGSYSMGKTVAEKVAARLNYTVVSRDLLLDASERYHIPEIKLIRAIHDAPGILERFSHSKQAFLAVIRAALTEKAEKGNMVYHGLAGHLMLKSIPGVLKVRITADLETRVANEMQREHISAQDARSLILKDDQQRRDWSKSIHGADTHDINLYDLVIRIDSLSVDDAVDMICRAAGSEGYQTTERTTRAMKDLALACRIKAELVEDFPNVGVISQYGNVVVYCKDKTQAGDKLHKRVEACCKLLEGLFSLEIHVTESMPPDAV
jgi:cytidylate kinase